MFENINNKVNTGIIKNFINELIEDCRDNDLLNLITMESILLENFQSNIHTFINKKPIKEIKFKQDDLYLFIDIKTCIDGIGTSLCKDFNFTIFINDIFQVNLDNINNSLKITLRNGNILIIIKKNIKNKV